MTVLQRSERADNVLRQISNACGKQTYFSIILYPESESYDWGNIVTSKYRYPKLDQWIEENSHRLQHWAYVTHHNDLDENGNLKKAHIHLGLVFAPDYRPTVYSLANEFYLPRSEHIICKKQKNFQWGTWEAQREYYVHDECEGKINAFSTFYSDEAYIPKAEKKERNKAEMRLEAEQNDVATLLELIDNVERGDTTRDFIQSILNANVWATYRRSQSTWLALFRERVYELESIARLRDTRDDTIEFFRSMPTT